MTCSPKLCCNTSDKNTNIGSDIFLFLCYESMYILPLNSVYSSTETLSMIISNKMYIFSLKDFSSFSLYDFSIAICEVFQHIRSRYLLWHTIFFTNINTAVEVLFHCMNLERTWQCSDLHALKLL